MWQNEVHSFATISPRAQPSSCDFSCSCRLGANCQCETLRREAEDSASQVISSLLDAFRHTFPPGFALSGTSARVPGFRKHSPPRATAACTPAASGRTALCTECALPTCWQDRRYSGRAARCRLRGNFAAAPHMAKDARRVRLTRSAPPAGASERPNRRCRQSCAEHPAAQRAGKLPLRRHAAHGKCLSTPKRRCSSLTRARPDSSPTL